LAPSWSIADLGKVYADLVADGLSPVDATLIERELQQAAKAIEHARQACAAIQSKTNQKRAA
jgi:hypothetical protein